MEPWGAEGPSGWELCLVSTFPSVEWTGHSIHECGSRVVLDSSSVNLSCGCCDWEPQKTFFISFNTPSLTQVLSRTVSVSQVSWDFPVILLLLIFSLIPLWSENIL